MGKRKEPETSEQIEEDDIVNVDFDFFDLVEDDFLSIKSLIRQLLGLDNVLFNLSDLTQLVMNAKIGTTIKADDEEYNDALAIMSVIDFDPKADLTGKLMQYWQGQIENPEMLRVLHRIKQDNKRIGLIISERFLNMPYEVVPPLYTILTQELEAKGLNYDYLIIPSRVYAQRRSELDGPDSNDRKRGAGASTTEFFEFHPEDAVISREALAATHFVFKTPVEETDSRRAFQDYGILPFGYLSVIDAKKLQSLGTAIAAYGQTAEEQLV